mgnify:FL=1
MIMSTVKVTYDFDCSDGDDIYYNIFETIEESGVQPITVKVYNDRIWDNVEIEFGNRELAILFTETYLGSTDPADLMEILGPDF